MGYERRSAILDAEGDTFVSVLHGGTNGVLVQASGTPRLTPSLRSAPRGGPCRHQGGRLC